MPESLASKQKRFPLMVAELIQYAYSMGYEVTFGDAYRDPRCPYGAKVSAHHRRLAIDLNLFKDKKYLIKTEDHLFLGVYWERMGGTWGGRWGDGNHYSLEHGGIK